MWAPLITGPVLLQIQNRLLFALHGDADHFATAQVLEFEPALERLTLWSAGQLPPIVIRPNGLEWLIARGVPLGVQPDLGLIPAACQFGPGDAVLLYTDGWSESRRPDGLRPREEDLLSLVEQHRSDEPEDLVQSLISAVCPVEGFDDDLLICVVKHRPW
jgi:serine phosphatase RsbU (regulator of sigma subunit)